MSTPLEQAAEKCADDLVGKGNEYSTSIEEAFKSGALWQEQQGTEWFTPDIIPEGMMKGGSELIEKFYSQTVLIHFPEDNMWFTGAYGYHKKMWQLSGAFGYVTSDKFVWTYLPKCNNVSKNVDKYANKRL